MLYISGLKLLLLCAKKLDGFGYESAQLYSYSRGAGNAIDCYSFV